MSDNDDVKAPSPLRVIEVEVPSDELAVALVGSAVKRARVIFVNMLPVEEPATLSALLPHGIVIEMKAPTAFDYDRVLIPWSKIAYITTVPPA